MKVKALRHKEAVTMRHNYRCRTFIKPKDRPLLQHRVPQEAHSSFRLPFDPSYCHFDTAHNKLSSPCAVILTALSVEFQAVRTHLTHLYEEVHPRGTVYERGIFFPSNNQPWNVAIVEIGKGNASAARETERAINYFLPNVILFVGVAGGLKDVQLGDVVAATKIYEYDSAKVTTTLQMRPSVMNIPYRLEQRIRAEARKSDWLHRIKEPLLERTPHVFVAPIAAGEKVIASTRSSEWHLLNAFCSDALAVETEGYGFFQTAHANPQVEAFAVRGISDLIDNKSEADAAHFQEIAASHASAFAFEILDKLNLAP